MARLISLTNEELSLLREKIKEQYLKDNPLVPKFSSNSTPSNYEGMLHHMQNSLPDYASEFSTKRLVKLFYSTQPERITSTPPNFGSRFIEGCYLYFTEGSIDRDGFNKVKNKTTFVEGFQETAVESHVQNDILTTKLYIQNRTIKYMLALLLVSLCCWAIYLSFSQKPKPIDENFDYQICADSLKAHGWQIYWQNDSLLNRQPKKGYLTLYTTEGDNWIVPEPAFFNNFVYRKLDCDCFEVITKIEDFDPRKPWQQAGIVLIEDPNRMKDFVRLTVVYSRTYKEKQEIGLFYIAIVSMRNEIPVSTGIILDTITSFSKPITTWLYVSVKKNRFSFKYRMDKEFYPFRDVRPEKIEINYPIFPKYVGLAAFHGFGDENHQPLSYSIIPAHFDYVKINPLPCDE